MVTGILAVVGTGIIASVLAVLLKQYRPELSFGVSLAASAVIFLFLLRELEPVVSGLRELSSRVSYPDGFLTALLKCLGISYLTELGSEVCRDSGQNAIASKIELGGRVLTAAIALPLFLSVLETALSLIQS